MIKNYLIIAWRSLLKNKLFSLINLSGLALSMSVGILVLIRMSDAFSYDNFHPDKQDIYRVITKVADQGGNKWTFASSPLPLQQALAGDVQSTLIYPSIHAQVSDASQEFDCSGAFIQPSFFEVFGFKLRSGNASSLSDPRSVMMSESFSRKFFGDNDPLGRVITINGLGDYEVTGIIATPPSKSHIDYDLYVAMQGVEVSKLQDWNTIESGYNYVRISNESERQVVTADLKQLKQALNQDPSQSLQFDLQPLTSISPSPSDIYGEIGRAPSRGSLMGEMAIALVILVAACFNYTNLSIARALTRGKEIGIRKLSGATRSQIIFQYITEALLISLCSLLIAGIVLAPILEYQPFNDGYEMIPKLVISWQLITLVAAFTLITALLAGGLPAWLLSSFRPARVLRNIATEKLMGHLSLRKTLLVFQFSLSLVVLVFLSTFYHQFDFLAKADPGFNTKGILLVPKGVHPEVTAASVSKLAEVEAVGYTSGKFGNNLSIAASREIAVKDPATMDYYACDEAWVNMMKLQVTAGSINLRSPAFVVLNERAARILGFQNSEQATGSLIYLNDSTRVTISAVVKDIYTHGYGNSIRPVVLRGDTSMFKFLSIQSTAMEVSAIEREWLKQNSNHSFDYTSLEADMRERSSQTATFSLLGFLGLITISIASLGLLGLVVYTVEVKRKEISVRKIVGASVHQIASLLSGGFLLMLCIAGLIALPIGYMISRLFLSNFVNHISISFGQLAGCFALLLIIGLITILSQTIVAANEDPARNLRSE